MQRIDNDTVRKILDTADIVEVVGDFVSLKRRGANYIGLCPFHNERTPSFSVSPSRGICKCFSCGKGGSPVGFIMEHEQLSYNEALRWLARKYNIEIKERELTAEEIAEANERESMMAINEFAQQFFTRTLTSTAEGRDIGLRYFRERGLTDEAIKRFALGYAPEQRDALCAEALAKGYSTHLLKDVGLCTVSERGSVYDRFRGRVIYPVFSLSGKVIAFGGRTLKTSKEVAKYVNSPESAIYHKSNTLYGLYQARRAIVNADKCLLVEGYMDVISMSQRGVENVVASSGTSLTESQIALIHRFTQNVTVIYDSDAAGIKASLRGIDLLLAQGLNIKVLLLPDGDDPDSFAQNHTLEEINRYIADNETDFIRFKTRILLGDVRQDDPIARAAVINNISRSISLVPDQVLRSVYIKECSRLLNAAEEVIALQVAKLAGEALVKAAPAADRDRVVPNKVSDVTVNARHGDAHDLASYLRPAEMELVRLMARYGFLSLGKVVDADGQTADLTVADYIAGELSADEMTLSNRDLLAVYDAALGLRDMWAAEYAGIAAQTDSAIEARRAEGQSAISAEATSVAAIQRMEKELTEQLEAERASMMADVAERFMIQRLSSSADDTVRRLSTSLTSEKYVLSKIHTKTSRVEAERDCLEDRVPKAVYALKIASLQWREKELRTRMAQNGGGDDSVELLRQLQNLRGVIADLAKYLGERIILPK